MRIWPITPLHQLDEKIGDAIADGNGKKRAVCARTKSVWKVQGTSLSDQAAMATLATVLQAHRGITICCESTPEESMAIRPVFRSGRRFCHVEEANREEDHRQPRGLGLPVAHR
jgi:hypothetical protein